MPRCILSQRLKLADRIRRSCRGGRDCECEGVTCCIAEIRTRCHSTHQQVEEILSYQALVLGTRCCKRVSLPILWVVILIADVANKFNRTCKAPRSFFVHQPKHPSSIKACCIFQSCGGRPRPRSWPRMPRLRMVGVSHFIPGIYVGAVDGSLNLGRPSFHPGEREPVVQMHSDFVMNAAQNFVFLDGIDHSICRQGISCLLC